MRMVQQCRLSAWQMLLHMNLQNSWKNVFQNRAPGFAYTRIANPTVDAFERRVNELEGGIGGVACSSGMSAVTLSLLNILQAGDEVIAGSALFGGTLDLLHDLEAFGIKVHFLYRG